MSLPEGWKPWQTDFKGGHRDAGPSEDEENSCTSEEPWEKHAGELLCMGTGFRGERIRLTDGAHKRTRTGEPSDFAYSEGLVHTLTEDVGDDGKLKNHVRALDEKTGKERWKHGTRASAVRTHDGVVGAEQTRTHWGPGQKTPAEREEDRRPRSEPGGDLIGWDPESGEEKWRAGTPDDKWCTPLEADGLTFASCVGKEFKAEPVTLYRVESGEGKAHRLAEVGTDTDTGGVGSKFLGHDERSLVFVPSEAAQPWDADYEELVRVDARTGKKRTVELPDGIPDSRPDLEAGTVYFRESDGKERKLIAVDATSGKKLWERKQPFEQLSAPEVSRKLGEVYFADSKGRIAALDRATGEEHWRAEAPRAEDGGTRTDELQAPSSVTLVHDALVVSAGNTVYSVSPADPSARPEKHRTVGLKGSEPDD